MSITGIQDMRSFREGNIFYDAVLQVDNLNTELDFSDIQTDVNRINNNYIDYNIRLAVYEGKTLVYPASFDTNHIVELALSENRNYLLIEENNAVYSSHTEKYTFILSTDEFSLYLKDPLADYFYIAILLFVFTIIIVFVVNRILTQFVSKWITTPIEILVSGVHELRDGNLNFRIEYKNNDEFKSVCNDFNEMAQHLSDMVVARKKDEANRKELIAGISHDLRTPLTSIKAYIEGIEKGIASTPQVQQKYIDTIKRKTADLEHIINQLFLFSKIDIGDFPLKAERVEINLVLNNFLNEAIVEYEDKGLSIMFDENRKKFYTDIDIVQFRNVLHNILQNSIKYKKNEFVKSIIDVNCKENNIVISVTDDGSGVPEESIDKLFDVFYRNDVSRKDPSSGSGLGLAICRKIIERLGGTIHAANPSGSGLAIIIKLPKSEVGAK
jgi:signal transduction histidine kinase